MTWPGDRDSIGAVATQRPEPGGPRQDGPAGAGTPNRACQPNGATDGPALTPTTPEPRAARAGGNHRRHAVGGRAAKAAHKAALPPDRGLLPLCAELLAGRHATRHGSACDLSHETSEVLTDRCADIVGRLTKIEPATATGLDAKIRCAISEIEYWNDRMAPDRLVLSVLRDVLAHLAVSA